MSEHTPGPWVVEAFANQDEARESGHFEWTLRDMGDCFEGGPVGVVWAQREGGGQSGLPGSIETSLPNARLIAAAPDLLDAVIQLRGLAQREGWRHVAIEAADAAIAKAEGRA